MEWLLLLGIGYVAYAWYHKHQVLKGNAPSPLPSPGVPAQFPAHPSGDITVYTLDGLGRVKLTDSARRILAPLLQNFRVAVIGAFPGEFTITNQTGLTTDGPIGVAVTDVLQSPLQVGTDVWISNNIMSVAARQPVSSNVFLPTNAADLQFILDGQAPVQGSTSSLPAAQSVNEANSQKMVLVLLRGAEETGASV
jgi:hypothetical protein